MESEPNQQPNDNSTRQANSIGSEELDAAILAAVQRANDVHDVDPSADDSNSYVFDGFDIVLIDPFNLEPLDDPYPWGPSAVTGDIPSAGEPYSGDENQDLSPQASISAPVEEVKSPQPAADDAVLGGQNRALVSDAVLGGIEGVKRRLASTFLEQQIAALVEALNYGKVGLDLVIQALNNESQLVAQTAYCLLRESSELIVEQALQEYNPYRFFQCTFSGNLWNHGEAPFAIQEYNPSRIFQCTFSGDSWDHGEPPIAISPDSKTLACGNRDGSITLWNLHTGKRLRTLRGHSGNILFLAINPDGQTLVTGSQDKSIKIWDLHTGEQIGILKRPSNPFSSVAISPDGQTLASSSPGRGIKLRNLHTHKEECTLQEKLPFVSSLAISPDGQTLVSGGDGSIKLWNLHTRKEKCILQGHSDGTFITVAISRDGQTLVSGSSDGTSKVWNLATGEHLYSINKYLGYSNAIAISPDSQTLISGSTEGSINFWNLSTGKLRHTLKGHSSYVNAIAISPDGQTLVSTSDDSIIKVWR